jgi:hypothetical protein
LAYCQEMVPEVGIAPTSPALQAGANLPQLLGENFVSTGMRAGRKTLIVLAASRIRIKRSGL